LLMSWQKVGKWAWDAPPKNANNVGSLAF